MKKQLKLEVGTQFVNNDNQECTITGFFVYDAEKPQLNTRNNLSTLAEAKAHYKVASNNRNSYVSFGIEYSDNNYGGAIDLIYNEPITVGETFLYSHAVITNRVHNVTKDMNQFKQDLLKKYFSTFYA